MGDGSNINVWSDPWLPDQAGFRVLSPRNSYSVNLKVRDLIDLIGTWLRRMQVWYSRF